MARGNDGTIVREKSHRKRIPLGGQGSREDRAGESRSCGGHQRMAMEGGRPGRLSGHVSQSKGGSLSTPQKVFLYSKSLQTSISHLKP